MLSYRESNTSLLFTYPNAHSTCLPTPYYTISAPAGNMLNSVLPRYSRHDSGYLGGHVVINPRRACAARVTVVVVCVCRLVTNSLLKGQFVLKTLSHTQRATKVKKFVGFSLKPLRCRDTALARCTATRAVGHFYSAENAHAHI